MNRKLNYYKPSQAKPSQAKPSQAKPSQYFKLFQILCLLIYKKYYISFYKKLSINKNKSFWLYKYIFNISNADINLYLNNSIKGV